MRPDEIVMLNNLLAKVRAKSLPPRETQFVRDLAQKARRDPSATLSKGQRHWLSKIYRR